MRESPKATRRTRQRDAIAKVITDSDRPLSFDEILSEASKEVSGLGIATVYRAVKLLAESGQVVSVEVPGVGALCESSGKSHHHHFHCGGCGRTFDLHSCPFSEQPSLPDGFSHEAHTITIFGKCDKCGSAPRSGREKGQEHGACGCGARRRQRCSTAGLNANSDKQQRRGLPLKSTYTK